MIIVPFFLQINNNDYVKPRPLTKLERLWFYLVVIFAIEITIGLFLLIFTETLGLYMTIIGIVGGFLMNFVMLILCCKQKI